MKIGILALQGAFIEHKHSLDALGVESFEIRQKKDIEKPFDGLIIPVSYTHLTLPTIA